MRKRHIAGETRVGQCLYRFWTSLDEDRGDRAALRRADTPTEVIFVPAFHRLRVELSEALRQESLGDTGVNPGRLATVAGLLAHLKTHVPLNSKAYESSTAVFMARAKAESSKAQVSELRFRRLLQVADSSELYPAMRRTLALMGGAVDLYALVSDVYFWGDRVKKRWAYDYYAKVNASQRANTA